MTKWFIRRPQVNYGIILHLSGLNLRSSEWILWSSIILQLSKGYPTVIHHPTAKWILWSSKQILRSFKNPMVICWWFRWEFVWMKWFPLCFNEFVFNFMFHGTAHRTASLSLPPLSPVYLACKPLFRINCLLLPSHLGFVEEYCHMTTASVSLTGSKFGWNLIMGSGRSRRDFPIGTSHTGYRF
jgi:hypothetical protein